MGSTTSIQPEIFALVKAEYEIKKLEGLSDELLFNHMKAFIDEKTEEANAAKVAVTTTDS